MNLDRGIRFTPAATGRFALLLGVSLVYLALFLSLGILVSALTQRSASTLVILLFAWALLVFVLPNLGTLIARQMVGVPSVKALSEKRRQIWTREVLLLEVERRAAGGRATGTRTEGDLARRHFDAINAEQNLLEEDYRRKFDRLVRLAKALNRISPAAGYLYAVTEIAGTGIGEESRLKDEIVRYKDAVLAGMAGGAKESPAFSYRYRAIGEVLAEGGLFDLAALVLAAVALFGAGFAAFVRYDVR